MIVQHNLAAMNASRMLSITSGQQAKSSEKLSSGYKINRAADDAAGLSISEKMRKQIKGLKQASSNAQDGISSVQTAEGALTEVHSMLQRMNELAVKASNGTMSDDDRKNIQDEIDQLTTEIDRVSETTKFNETYLLKGDSEQTATYKTLGFSLTPQNSTNTVQYISQQDDSGVAKVKIISDKLGKNAVSTDKVTVAGHDFNLADYKTIDELKDAISSYKDVAKVETKTIGTINITKYANEAVASISTADTGFTLSDSNYEAGSGTLTFKLAASNVTDGNKTISVAGQNISYDGTADVTETLGKIATAIKNDTHFSDATQSNGIFTVKLKGTTTQAATTDLEITAAKEATKLNFSLHVGSESDEHNKIDVKVTSMDSESLGIKGIKVTTNKIATDSIDTIADAIKAVSAQRSSLGAVQNRLEHTIANLDNVVENTTAAEARIRDVDMAAEMVEYSKNNILAQAGQSMLAQANQSTQGILALLR